MKKSLTLLASGFLVLFLALLGCCSNCGLPNQSVNTNGSDANRVNTANGLSPTATKTATIGNSKTPPPGTPSPTPEAKEETGKFSFPPPKATTAARKPLGDLPPRQFVFVLQQRLDAAGYGDFRHFFFSRNDESAVVTLMEQIDADGRPVGGARRFDLKIAGAGGVGEYFGFLLSGKRAFYRTIVFYVTEDARFNPQSGVETNFAAAAKWKESRLGAEESLPGEVEKAPDGTIVRPFYCYALVYVFEKHTSDAAERFLETFPVSASEQLARSGIEF